MKPTYGQLLKALRALVFATPPDRPLLVAQAHDLLRLVEPLPAATADTGAADVVPVRREHLAAIEWNGCVGHAYASMAACPACDEERHAPDCWLAAALAAPPAAGAPPALVALDIPKLLQEAKRFGRLAEQFVGAAPREGQARRAERDAAVHALRDTEKLLIRLVEQQRASQSLVPAPVAKEETCVVCDGPVVDASGHQACVAGRYDAVVCGPCRSELAAPAPHPAGGVMTDYRGSDGAMLAPADEARKVISACTARGARLPDMHQLQSAITDIIVERNRQAGVGLRFRDINTGVVTDEFGREHHPSFEAKTHQDSLQNVAASTLDTPAHTSVPACPEGQHSYRRNAPPQPGDVCFVCRKSIYMPAAPFVVSPGDVVVSKLGNRWTVTAVDGRLLLLHNAPPEVPGARGTTVSGPMPEWAAVVERNGAVIWSAQPQTPGCDCDQPGNPDVACHAPDCLWRVALAPAVERAQ